MVRGAGRHRASLGGTAYDPERDPMLDLERAAQREGFASVAGVDEAGRGPLAGPIVAGAAVLAEPLPGLTDSKQLTPETRDMYFAALMSGGHAVAVAVIESREIDRHGIQWANYAAMHRALEGLSPRPMYALVDGFSIPGCAIPHARVIKGDARSMSIAAASVLAKVTRDRLMLEYDAQYPEYGFVRHKGYATAEHLEAIRRHGPCPIHRTSFAPLAQHPQTALLFEEGSEEVCVHD